MNTKHLCLHQLFQLQANRTPDSVAVVDGDKANTYAEIDRLSDVLAGYCQRQGVTFDNAVGIFMETCVEYLISYIAILKAGGAYMPLDLAYPDPLLEKILGEAKPKVIITKSQYSHRLDSSLEAKILNIDIDETWRSDTYDKDIVSSISLNNLD